MKKTFILDTNALIYNCRAIYHFGDNDVVIPFIVLEEVDRLKTKGEKVGESARKVNRELEKLRVLAKSQNSSLSMGVELESGGTFKIWTPSVSVHDSIPDKEKADNIIISTAMEIKKIRRNERVIVVSKDLNVRVKCDALGLEVEDFNDHLEVEEIYDGSAPDMHITEHLSNRLHAGEKVPMEEFIDGLNQAMPEFELFPNMYAKLLAPVGINSTKNPSVLVKFKESEQHGFTVEKIKEHKMWGVAGQNVEQRYAIDALMDPSVSLVTLSGFAGTGKTLCAIAAALEQTDLFVVGNAAGSGKPSTPKKASSGPRPYNRIVISRPLEPFHKEIGFLPGDLNEKMSPWLSPLWDNMEYLFRNNNQGRKDIDMFIDSGAIEIRALTHIRGSSIGHSFIIIDECQNLTKHELKTILTRVGNGSKLVLTGDVEQIDNPHLDKLNSGLAIVIELFKDAGITSHVTLKKGLRSELATLAIKKFE